MIDAIYVDLDDTFVEFTPEVVEYFTGSRDCSGVTDYDSALLKVCGCTSEQFGALMSRSNFWSNLRWSILGLHLFDEIAHCGIPYTVLTALPKSKGLLACQAAATGKLTWLDRYGITSYNLATDKSIVAAPTKLLIDDNPIKVAAFIRSGGRGIVIPQPWNTETRDPIVQLHDILGELARYGREPDDCRDPFEESYYPRPCGEIALGESSICVLPAPEPESADVQSLEAYDDLIDFHAISERSKFTPSLIRSRFTAV